MFRRIVVAGLLAFLAGVVVAEAARNRYGAIAYSVGSGRYGYVAGTATREEAQTEALRSCRSKGCEIQLWFRNACGAVAVGNDGQVTGWGWAAAQPDAERRAIAECRKHGEKCYVIVATCAQPGATNQSGSGRVQQ